MASKKKQCKRKCDDCEATIKQMFTLDEMFLIRNNLSDTWCQPRDWATMKELLKKLNAVIAEVVSEQPVR